MSQWKDQTSYSRNDPEPRVASTWEIEVRDLRIVVTRRIHEEGWHLVTYPDVVSCSFGRDMPIERAKPRALGLVESALRRMADDVKKIPTEDGST